MTESPSVAPKPVQLQLFATQVGNVFHALREAFPGTDQLAIDASQLERPNPPLDSLDAVITFTLRALQGLYRCTQPGVPVVADVVINLLSQTMRNLNEIKEHVDPEMERHISDYLSMGAEVGIVIHRTTREDPLRPMM